MLGFEDCRNTLNLLMKAIRVAIPLWSALKDENLLKRSVPNRLRTDSVFFDANVRISGSLSEVTIRLGFVSSSPWRRKGGPVIHVEVCSFLAEIRLVPISAGCI